MSFNRFFDLFVMMTLVSFGFFGSLSHLFSIGIIGTVIVHQLCNKIKPDIDLTRLLLFFVVSANFFLLLIRSLFTNSFHDVMVSISPMLAIPLLSCLILIQNKKMFSINSFQVAQHSKYAILFCVLIYLLLLQFPENENIGLTGRISMLSGNPIPFSLTVFGLSIFCLAYWDEGNKGHKIQAFICFIVGAYIATIGTNTRGTFLSLLICLPYLIWFLSKSLRALLISIILIFAISGLVVILQFNGYIQNIYVNGIINGLSTLILNSQIDASQIIRLQLWRASLETIIEAPFWGYGILERFSAIQPNLPQDFLYKFSHPHNDIMASFIGTGFFGAIFATVTLLGPIWAAVLSRKKSSTILFLGITINISIFITANVNTVFFNDISAAWLAFSTFLIWNIGQSKMADTK